MQDWGMASDPPRPTPPEAPEARRHDAAPPGIGSAFAALWRYPVVRVAIALLVLAGAFVFIRATLGTWISFLLALLVAYLVQPLMVWSERRLRARWLGLVVFLLGFFTLLGLFSVLLAGLVRQMTVFVTELPTLLEGLAALLTRLPGWLNTLPLPAALGTALLNAYQSLGGTLEALSNRVLAGLETLLTSGQVVGGVTVVVGDVFQFFGFLAMTAYLLNDLPRVQRTLANLFPVPYQPLARDLTRKLELSVGDYFRGQLVIALIVGGLVGVGLAILQLPLAASIAFLAGLFNLVPYLGVVVAITPALLVAAPLGWLQMLGVVVVFVVTNQLETHLLSPLILGRSTRLHPVTIIIAILVGARLAGLLGAIFAVPVAGFLKLVYEEYYFSSRFYREG